MHASFFQQPHHHNLTSSIISASYAHLKHSTKCSLRFDAHTGYCFCMIQDHTGSNNLRGIKTLYIDDLCIDERMRGQHIGHQIYNYVKSYAREQGFYNLTLNVWSCNPGAMRFYESLGLKPQKIGMEAVLFPEGADHA
ncbi:MAG: GNAT family N-acetyltransferase [Bacteroides sp.]|nr:GNAT family N-acetyltransferase [Bacteroides sp.]